MERGPFWRAGLLPESPWEAHPVTIIANLGEPIGESRLVQLAQKRLCVLQVAGVKALGEPPIYGAKQVVDFLGLVLALPQPREQGGGAS